MAYSPGPLTLPTDPAEARALADACVALWITRDERMREEALALNLDPITLKPYEERVSVHDAPILLEKFVEEQARVDLHISVATDETQDREAAQRVEDGAYWWLREVQSRHAQTLHAPFKYEACHFLAARGWLVAECLVNPGDPGFPWSVRLLDPINVYPDRDCGTPGLFVHRYRSSWRELRDYWGAAALKKARQAGNYSSDQPTDHDLSTTAVCYGFYTPTEMGVLLETGGWLKKPIAHGYGRNPLVVAVAPGSPIRRVEDTDTETHVKQIGPGFLRAILGPIKDKARVAARIMRVLTKTAAPPYFVATSDPDLTAEDIDVEPNAITVGRQGDAVTPLVPPPVAFQYATGLLSLLNDQTNRGGVNPQLFGEGTPGSGYDRTKAIGTGLSKIELYLETLAFWYETLLRLMLRQFAFHGGPLPYLAPDRTTGLRTAANRLTPYDVLGADWRLEVKFGNLMDVDQVQMGTLAAQLVDRGIADPEFALGELMKIDNPTAIIRRATKYQAFKDPAMLRLLSMAEWANIPPEALEPMWQMAFAAQMQQFVQGLQGTALGGPNMGGPPTGSPPLPNSGVPSAALPPEMAMMGAGLPGNSVGLGPPQVGAGLQAPIPLI